jgi:hypothetical protein
MGWVITTWHTDRLAALLDADTREAADDVVRRADRDARRLRRAARRETGGVAAALEALERLGSEALDDVRLQRGRWRDDGARPAPTRPRSGAAAPISARVRRADALGRLTADVRRAATGEPAPRRPQPAAPERSPARAVPPLAPARPRPSAAPAPAAAAPAPPPAPAAPLTAPAPAAAPAPPPAPAPPLTARPDWWAPDTLPARVHTADPVPPPVPPTAPVRRRRFQRAEPPPEVAPVPRRQTSGTRRGRASLRESVLNDLFRSTELADRA